MALLMFWGDVLLIVIRNRKKSEMGMYEKLVIFFPALNFNPVPLLIVRSLLLT